MTRHAIADAFDQPVLREMLDLLRDGWKPQFEATLSPELARQITGFRDRIAADVTVIAVQETRAVAIVEPHDGGDLFLLAFDALRLVGEGARH